MALANPLWGAPRIHGELLKLGLDVSQRTVARLMPRRPKPPSQTWRTFLQNHVADLASVDFFVVPTATFRVLYVFVLLLHPRRRIALFNVTDSPTAAWTARQIVEAFPDDSAPRYLLRDRDSIYGAEFRRRVQAIGIAELLAAPRSPWQNPFVERVIGTIRRELSLPKSPSAPHGAKARMRVVPQVARNSSAMMRKCSSPRRCFPCSGFYSDRFEPRLERTGCRSPEPRSSGIH